tara:strand:+ start:358 stop:909 length:552 start_codon:yes stop_codon:yes gene_type:complete
MAIRPSQPEVIAVISEQLQTQVRDLLPSQNGFGSELMATNVITPVIDLTAAAEGSGLPTYLQTALAFGSQTAFDARNGTTALAASAGFWRVVGVAVVKNAAAADHSFLLQINDGVDDKTIYGAEVISAPDLQFPTIPFDLTVFLRAGDTLNIVNNSSSISVQGSYRQVATGDGTLVQPNGFPL